MCLRLRSSHQNTFLCPRTSAPVSFLSQGAALCLFDRNGRYTFFAGRPSVRGVRAVAHVAGALLHTPAPVVADARRAAAVPRAPRAHTWRCLGSLVQVEGRAVHIECSHAAQKTSLPRGCSSCHKENTLVNQSRTTDTFPLSLQAII